MPIRGIGFSWIVRLVQIPDSSKLKRISSSDTLENIFNKWSKILLTNPESCPGWKKDVFKMLHTLRDSDKKCV